MFAENLSDFLSPSEHASSVTVGGSTVAAIFSNGYQSGLAGFVESTGPSLLCKTADVAAAVQGTAVTVASTAYKVATVQPDGTGFTTLVLELA